MARLGPVASSISRQLASCRSNQTLWKLLGWNSEPVCAHYHIICREDYIKDYISNNKTEDIRDGESGWKGFFFFFIVRFLLNLYLWNLCWIFCLCITDFLSVPHVRRLKVLFRLSPYLSTPFPTPTSCLKNRLENYKSIADKKKM